MRYITLIALIFLSAENHAYGYGLSPIGFNVRSVAMGGTSVASANDASAIYSNPALLAKVRNITFNGSFVTGADNIGSSTNYDIGYREPYVVKMGGYGKTFLALDMIGFVFPSMQSSVDNSYGLTFRTEYLTETRSYESSPFVNGRECFSFGSGVKLIENLLVGYSLNLRFGSERHGYDKRTYKGINAGTGLAIVFPGSPVFVPTTFGITYALPYEMEFEYSGGYGHIRPYGNDGYISDSEFNPMDIPSQFGFGAAWEINNLLFTLDMKRFGYSNIDNYSKDIYHIMTGIEYTKELDKLTLHTRAGYANKDVDLYNIDGSFVKSNIFSAGCGVEHKLITYEIAVLYNNGSEYGYIADYYTSKKEIDEFRIFMGLKITGK